LPPVGLNLSRLARNDERRLVTFAGIQVG
jgi:hypothetical protein